MSVGPLDPGRCSVCAHIRDHGWTGLDKATHCRRCHSIWGGTSAQHCVSCCQTFSSLSAADAHRRDGKCMDAETVLTKTDDAVFGVPRVNDYGCRIWSLAYRGPARAVTPLNRLTQSLSGGLGIERGMSELTA